MRRLMATKMQLHGLHITDQTLRQISDGFDIIKVSPHQSFTVIMLQMLPFSLLFNDMSFCSELKNILTVRLWLVVNLGYLPKPMCLYTCDC